MHDLVCEDLSRIYPGGPGQPVIDRAAARAITDMQARKQFGLRKYGTLLQAYNGHDALRDLYEELQDAAVYARQVMAENGQLLPADYIYTSILHMLVAVAGMRDEHP